MPTLKMYDLFLSHMWRYGENTEYYRLVEMLNQAPNFLWRNYSVPEHDPLNTKSDRELREALNMQIRPVNCFVIISGMYAIYRKWIKEEMDIAKSYSKPIIGIRPWGQDRTPIDVQNTANEMVSWNTDSIIAAIRRCAI